MIFSVLPKNEDGSESSIKINKVASFIAHLYAQLPIIITIIFVTLGIDPLHYFLPSWSLPLRSITIIRGILFLTSTTEIGRFAVISILVVLFAINAAKREMTMWMNIARRSNLRGMYFYKQIAILYTRRRYWSTPLLTLIMVVGLVLQVNLHKSGRIRIENFDKIKSNLHKYLLISRFRVMK